jgi:tetratricopeptide (TPR) repeat protein
MNARLPVVTATMLVAAVGGVMVGLTGRTRAPAAAPAKPDFYKWACGTGIGGVGGQPSGDVQPGPALIYDGLSDVHYAVSTKSADAQMYFDQGLRLIYAFNHDEAQRSFAKAAEFDPACAMCQWGVALVLGPNYNMPAFDERSKAAYAAVQKAVQLSASATEKERALITALTKRYSQTPPSSKEGQDNLNKAYADAMRDVSHKFADDLDIATLFAESMMTIRPWDLWTKDGKPQPGTDEIVATLERVIKAHPTPPRANHYYIHAVEASTNPDRALASANRLGGLAPGAGHLVHMPAHIYIRTGDYSAAAEVNRKALKVDAAYLAKSGLKGVYPTMYVAHNAHFLAVSAAIKGRSAEAIKAGRDAQSRGDLQMFRAFPPMNYMMPVTLQMMARFGKWDDILAEPAFPDELVYPAAIQHFTRGLAFLGTGDVPGAEKELAAVKAAQKAAPDDLVADLNSVKALLDVAGGVLGGKIAAAKGDTKAAVQLLETAVSAEDGLNYSEPPDWALPSRLSLGALYMLTNDAKSAEATFRADLRVHRNNPWSMWGLAEALRGQGSAEAKAAGDEAKKAWADADVVLDLSWY